MTIADLFNSATELRWPDEPGGKVYHCRQLTGLEQGMFQRWLEQRALDGIERRTYQDESTRERDRQLHNQDVAVGTYEWSGLLAVKATRTPAGLAKCLQIALRDQGMTDEVAVKVVEHKFNEVAATLASKLTDDPKEARLIFLSLGVQPPADLESATSSSACATPRSPTPWITSADLATTS
jgi:hypothetical protein